MSEKLTCKMSEGTEWEVSIKRKPREGWDFVRKDRRYLSCETAEKAAEVVSYFVDADAYEVIKIREVLEEK